MSTVILHCGMKSCGTANRVARSKVLQAKCGKCKHSLLFSPDMKNLPPEEVPDEDFGFDGTEEEPEEEEEEESGDPADEELLELDLTTVDGNAFAILGAFKAQAKKQKWSKESIQAVLDEATAGDYDHLLSTIMQYCN